MRAILIVTLVLIGFIATCFGQQNLNWNRWNWLMGNWVGEGNGQPGQGGGTFSFKLDLDKKIMIRKSHSEYPATTGKKQVIHDDLMVVYMDFSGNPSKAIYFDNEGHTISYSITYADKSIIFISDKMPNVPVFRLTYSLLDNSNVNTKFEMSHDGQKFMTYIEGKSKKAKQLLKFAPFTRE